MVSLLLLGVLFSAAMLVEFVDSITGGDGLLITPALMVAGMPPANTLAANKLQACGGSIPTTIYFTRRRVVSLDDQKLNIAMTFVSSMGSALLIRHVQADILRQVLLILMICIDLYFLLVPKLGEEDRQCRMYGLLFVLITGDYVGSYDEFFGPVAGSFHALTFVTLCGFNLAEAAARARLLNVTPGIGGLLLFILGGKVIWATGFVMLMRQFLDARMGSRPVLGKRQKLVRLVIATISAVINAKLFYDNYGQEILHWLGMN